MKRAIAMLSLLALFVPVSIALARGNHRFAIDQQWKREEACQKKESERLKKLERLQRGTGSDKGIIPLVPSDGRQRQSPR
jgi:hypothetical protein